MLEASGITVVPPPRSCQAASYSLLAPTPSQTPQTHQCRADPLPTVESRDQAANRNMESDSKSSESVKGSDKNSRAFFFFFLIVITVDQYHLGDGQDEIKGGTNDEGGSHTRTYPFII